MMTFVLSYSINWAVFVFQAGPQQTEKYFDLTGSITYVSCTVYSLISGASPVSRVTAYGVKTTVVDWTFNPRPLIQSLFVILWALRLGSFLFSRIK